jgi:hypothetical protein
MACTSGGHKSSDKSYVTTFRWELSLIPKHKVAVPLGPATRSAPDRKENRTLRLRLYTSRRVPVPARMLNKCTRSHLEPAPAGEGSAVRETRRVALALLGRCPILCAGAGAAQGVGLRRLCAFCIPTFSVGTSRLSAPRPRDLLRSRRICASRHFGTRHRSPAPRRRSRPGRDSSLATASDPSAPASRCLVSGVWSPMDCSGVPKSDPIPSGLTPAARPPRHTCPPWRGTPVARGHSPI